MSKRFWDLVVEPESAELRIDGDIVDDEDAWLYDWFGDPHAAPSEMRDALAELGQRPLTVWIDSYGGSTFAGIGIYNALKAYPGRVSVLIDSKAMSAATIIAMAGDTVEMTPGAIFMIHNPWTSAIGYADEMRKTADVLDTVKDAIINVYTQRTHLSREHISELMDEETYMSAQQAVDLGFADSIRQEAGSVPVVFGGFRRAAIVNSARVDLGRLAKVLAEREQQEPEAVEPEELPQAAEQADQPEPPLVEDRAQEYNNRLAYLRVTDIMEAM